MRKDACWLGLLRSEGGIPTDSRVANEKCFLLLKKSRKSLPVLGRVQSPPPQKQRIGRDRERKRARNQASWDSGVRRSVARTRANIGGNEQKNQPRLVGFLNSGGGERDRTAGLDVANVALSQLSYTPEWV